MTSCFLNWHFKRLKENVILKKSIDVCRAKEWVDGEITSPSAKVLATVPRGHIFIFIFRDALQFAALPFLPVCRQSFSLLVNADSPNPIFLFLSPRLSGRHLQFGLRPATSIFHFSPSCQVFSCSLPFHWRHCAIPCPILSCWELNNKMKLFKCQNVEGKKILARVLTDLYLMSTTHPEPAAAPLTCMSLKDTHSAQSSGPVSLALSLSRSLFHSLHI